MEALRRLVPSINSLVVFEAAGRQASFSAAARELGITQAAVSYAIGRLETHLSTSLFVREHRRVRLTEAGQRFYADVSLGLSHIHKSAQALRFAASSAHVTLSASAAFAAYWMAPRLQKFREDLPGVDLRIQTSDRDLDLSGEGIPLGIRGGSPRDWPDYDCAAVAAESIYPVCGTSYAARFGAPESVGSLRGHRLIHLDEPYRPACTWREWLQSAGAADRHLQGGLRINDYVSVIQAAIEGQGIALGWGHLVERLVARGLLIQLTDHTLLTGHSFFVTWPRNVQLSRTAIQVRDWLADHIRAS